jgi:hypothetical protein
MAAAHGGLPTRRTRANMPPRRVRTTRSRRGHDAVTDRRGGRGRYTASWAAPKSDVHSQQRFFYMGHAGELTARPKQMATRRGNTPTHNSGGGSASSAPAGGRAGGWAGGRKGTRVLTTGGRAGGLGGAYPPGGPWRHSPNIPRGMYGYLL